MPSEKFVSDALEGATKGALEWSSDKISSWIKKLKERKLAFIKEQKTIDIVKEQYRSGEGSFYQKYVADKELLLLIRMGLTLRKLENDKDRLMNLRDKIYKKYKAKGLHIAEFVQNRLLNRYVGILIDELDSLESLGRDIEDVLKNIEKHVLFVQGFEKPHDIIIKSMTIINSHSPNIFVVSGAKSAAQIVGEIRGKLASSLKDYELETISELEIENLFFKRILHKPL